MQLVSRSGEVAALKRTCHARRQHTYMKVSPIVWVALLGLYTLLLAVFLSTPSRKPTGPAMFRPQLLLFGDSITQKGFAPGGWAGALADAYQRKADVISRGYSGYNSRWALQLLDRVLPAELAGQVLLSTVFFGANDAALPDRSSARQHVPIPEFVDNLRTVVKRMRELQVPAIVIITPPPISEADRIIYVEKKFGVKQELSERTNEVTGKYAAACVALGNELGVPVLDIWTEFQNVQGWQQGLLEDGLHLTEAGNKKVATLLLALIARRYPMLRPDNMAEDAPLNADINPKDPEATFREFYARRDSKA